MENHHSWFRKNQKPTLGSKFAVGVFVIAVVLVSISCMVSVFVSKDGGKVDNNTYQVVVLRNTQSYFRK